MIRNYTQDAKKRCLALVDSDVDDIWDSIEKLPSDTDADKWKKKILQMVREYTFSSPFALMRLFLNRADESQLIDAAHPEYGFVATLSDGTTCRIEDITIQHAESLSSEELDQFENLLLEQASLQSDSDSSVDSAIIKKALVPVQRKTTLLSRDEAFLLGHILQFTLQEMEWFLLRVFDVEDGFAYNTSNDLIEAYGFLSNKSWKAVSILKDEYEKRFGSFPKKNCEEKTDDWTKDTAGSLPEMEKYWSQHCNDKKDEMFLLWLGDKAPFLDSPSQAALQIYRNLAVYAHNLALRIEDTPEVDIKRQRRDGRYETDFLRSIREIVSERGYADQTLTALFEKGNISFKCCEKVAKSILFMNKQLFSTETDASHAVRTIKVKQDGEATVNDGKSASRTRVRDLLTGGIVNIEKSDMLYMLWFTSLLCWFDGERYLEPDAISNRINDFIDAAEICLDEAGLPAFYPPHLMEQSMMLSIVYAYFDPDENEPDEVYETICKSVVKSRARRSKS